MSQVKKILRDSRNLSKKIYEDKIVKKSFTYDNINFLNLLDLKLDYFFWKILEGIDNLKNYKDQKGSKITSAIFTSPLNHDLTHLVYKLNLNKKIFISKISNSPSQNNLLIIFINSIARSLLSHRLRGSKGILFVMPGRHAIELLPLFKMFKKERIPYLLICYNLDNVQFIKLLFSGINFVTKAEIRSSALVEEAGWITKQFRSRWLKKTDTFKIAGGNTRRANIINKASSLRIRSFLEIEAEETVIDYLSALDIFESRSFKTLITSTDPDVKVLPFIVAARKKKLETITLQHGAFARPESVNFVSQKMLGWGDYWRNWYFKMLKKNKKNIIITGSAFFDKFNLQSFKKVGIKPRVLFLLVDPYLNVGRFKQDLNQIVTSMLKLGASTVTLRPHPWQKIVLSNFISKDSVKVDLGMSLNNALKKTDLVITMDTTAGYNAIILGKPTIYWDFLKLKRMAFEKCGVPRATNLDELTHLYKVISKNEMSFSDISTRAHLKEIFYKLDGKSYLRIYNEISKSL